MTLNQLESLTQEELSLVLHIVNVISPPELSVKIDFSPRNLTWFKHDVIIKKILDSFPKVKNEYHAIYSSLLNKLGVQHEIKYEQPPAPVTASNQVTSSA